MHMYTSWLGDLLPVAASLLLVVGIDRRLRGLALGGAALAGLMLALSDGTGVLLAVLSVLLLHAASAAARDFVRAIAGGGLAVFAIAAGAGVLAGLPSIGVDVMSLLAVCFDDSVSPGAALAALGGAYGPAYVATIALLLGYGLVRGRRAGR